MWSLRVISEDRMGDEPCQQRSENRVQVVRLFAMPYQSGIEAECRAVLLRGPCTSNWQRWSAEHMDLAVEAMEGSWKVVLTGRQPLLPSTGQMRD